MPQERQTCTKEHPFHEGDKGLWCHPEAIYEDDEYGSLASGGSYEIYRCPICNHKFYVELPD